MADNHISSVVISSGHSLLVRGASGYLDEVDEARRVADRVGELLASLDVEVAVFHDDTSTSQNENLNTIVDFHNQQTRQLDVSVHFNAYDDTSDPMGVEVLYVTQQGLAEDLSYDISSSGSFIDRGAKQRTDLFFLNNTDMPAVLIEVCFVDSSSDAELYRDKFEEICVSIAQCLSGRELDVSPEPPRPVRPPPDVTGDNRVDIVGAVRGDVDLIINGSPICGRPRCPNAVVMNITMTGDVTVSINGEDFHNRE